MFHVLNLEKRYPRDNILTGLVPWLLWRLWKNKNEFMFKGKDYEAMSLIRKAQEDAEEWRDMKKDELQEAKLKGHNGSASIKHNVIWRPP